MAKSAGANFCRAGLYKNEGENSSLAAVVVRGNQGHFFVLSTAIGEGHP
jgi:hypothetical protein